jgi:hypothetical protein
MSGEYLKETSIGDIGNKRVFIVKGGWSCNAGYMVWAYVAEDTGEKVTYAKTLYDKQIARIGKRLFEQPNKLGDMYEDELLNKSIEFVKSNNYYCNTIIVMKTD